MAEEEIEIGSLLTGRNIVVILIIFLAVVGFIYLSGKHIEKRSDAYSRLFRFEDFMNDIYETGGVGTSVSPAIIRITPDMTFEQLMFTYNLNINRPSARDWIINKLNRVCDGTGWKDTGINYTAQDLGKIKIYGS